MSDNDKMREAFEKWALSNDGPSVSVTRNDVGRYEDEELNMAWLGWQAAQAVPVVGDVVAYGVPNSRPNESSPLMQVMLQIPPDAQYPGLLVPLIVQPTTSITEAELERLRNRVASTERDLAVAVAEGDRIMCDWQEQIRKTCAALKQRNDAEQACDALRKDAERLRDALRYYGTHSNACDMSRFVSPAGCTCGYDAAIAAEGEKE